MDTPQPSTVTPEDIHAWLTEIRDLKNTVTALRNTLEQELDDKKKSVQEAVAASSTEIVQLKSTAAALREALEQARIDRDKAVQDAVVTANHEIVQLRSAASALRDALELERQDKECSVQAAVRAAHDAWGEVPVLVTEHPVDLDAVRGAVAAAAGPAARPDRLMVVPRMPLLPSGKPDRKRLEQLARDASG